MVDIQDLITHPENLDRDSLYALRTILARYPYFQTARLLYLKNLYVLHDVSFGDELRQSIIYITNRKFLYHFIEGEFNLVSSAKKSVLPSGSQPTNERTIALIDSFLASMPEESNYASIGNGIATDYASYLLRNEIVSAEDKSEASPMRGQELIDSFIEKADEGNLFVRKPEPIEGSEAEHPVIDDGPTEQVDADEDESFFTETLAKIYIKQQRYAKAIEIIKKLSLKYPKKNAYFADQIKFLEKLIINAKSKK